MDCRRARERLDEPVLDGQVLAHLEACDACRAELAFGRRVAAAVAAMPREQAPEGFAARVMAEVRRRPATPRAPSRLPQLALRPWEMAGIAALCVLLAALVPMALHGWPGWGWGDFSSWFPALSSLYQAPQTLWRDLSGLRHVADGYGIAETGLSLVWLCGAAAFATAFSLLLSWRPARSGGRGVEDAHA